MKRGPEKSKNLSFPTKNEDPQLPPIGKKSDDLGNLNNKRDKRKPREDGAMAKRSGGARPRSFNDDGLTKNRSWNGRVEGKG